MALSVKDKIGQMLVYGWTADTSGSAKTLNDHARRLIDEFHVGGLILMERNIGDPEEVRSLTAAAQLLAKSNGIPGLLIATDQEGGRVSRFQPPCYPAFPSAAEIGATKDVKTSFDNAEAIGLVLSLVGVNWALMPVLDVNNNPGNTVIGDRSFGPEPHLVAELGAASVLGMQNAGVMACGKHFPGHGDTDVDSHIDLPVIDHPSARLDTVELPPFRAAIEAGVGSIMTSHILFRELDSDLPATLSPTIISGLLRKELGYDGLVISDCLEMKGVAKKWGTAEAAVLSAIAGADMLLVCHTEKTQEEVHIALLRAHETGRLTEQRIDEANNKIRRAKEAWL